MKIDRMLRIIIHLLNHECVSARQLAKQMNVSVRTIQRDMITISLAGIPLYSVSGKRGGYSILPTYKIKNSDISHDEQQMIMKALESLSTSYTNDTLNTLIEKYNAMIEKEGGQKIFWDFGVAKENKQVQNLNDLLEKAISEKRYITFDYRNAAGSLSHPCVEPLAIYYKWYAWYLFAYSDKKEQFRTYKIARIQNLQALEKMSLTDHGNIAQRMEESEQAYYKTCIHIEVHFAKTEIGLMQEYFPDCMAEPLNEEMCRIFIDVPPGERLWKALLLSFGDKVRVVGPEDYKKELVETAEKFLSNYDIQLSR